MKPRAPPLLSTRLLDQVRERIRYMHYSFATEKVYLYWVRFFVRWSGHHDGGQMRHPRDIDAKGVEAFLTMLATERHVSAATHNQALSAILFLYREVLAIDLPWLNGINRPTRKPRIPTVMTQAEVAGVLAQMEDGITAVLAQLLYGTGMRLMEAMRLRIKDVDFARRLIIVREAKGGKDCVVMLPGALAPQLHRQLLAARAQWEADRQSQRGGVETPHALDAKYPRAGQSWAWFWLFPSPTLSIDPRSGVERRHHLYEDRVQRGAEKGGCTGRHCQTGVRAHLAPFVRHPPTAVWHRHPHRAGAARPFGCQHYHDLHPCAQGCRWRHVQSTGYAVVRFASTANAGRRYGAGCAASRAGQVLRENLHVTTADRPSADAPPLRLIAHLDMDAFYASVELLRYPQLKGLPVVIGGGRSAVQAALDALADNPDAQAGGNPRAYIPVDAFARLKDYVGRGVITTATYAARQFGIGSAMGLMKAAKLCPQAIQLPVDFEEYRRFSRAFKQIILDIAPRMENRGVDEVYIDFTEVSGGQREGGRVLARLIQKAFLRLLVSPALWVWRPTNCWPRWPASSTNPTASPSFTIKTCKAWSGRWLAARSTVLAPRQTPSCRATVSTPSASWRKKTSSG